MQVTARADTATAFLYVTTAIINECKEGTLNIDDTSAKLLLDARLIYRMSDIGESVKTLPTKTNNNTPLQAVSRHGRASDLSLSAYLGDLDEIKWLVSLGVDMDDKNSFGQTPISLAAEYGHLEVVRFLAGNGADADIRDNDGKTPILKAIWDGHLEIVNFLAGHGVDIDVGDEYGQTPLSIAIIRRDLGMVKFLVGHGADVEVRDHRGIKLPAKGVNGRQLEIVKFLEEVSEKRKRIAFAAVGNFTKSAVRR